MNASLTQVDILRPLRDASGALHHALDSQLAIARDDASLDDYLGHLRRLRPWLSDIRRALAAPGDAALDQAARRIDDRLAALDLDLASDPAADAPAGRPPGAAASPPFVEEATREPAFAWGLAYVVEGSQLGGAVMHRRLAPRLAPHPLRYFMVDGLGARWREFVAQLGVALHDDPAAVAAAQRGAVAAFERLLARCGLGLPPAMPGTAPEAAS
jgi:heme oxygenase